MQEKCGTNPQIDQQINGNVENKRYRRVCRSCRPRSPFVIEKVQSRQFKTSTDDTQPTACDICDESIEGQYYFKVETAEV